MRKVDWKGGAQCAVSITFDLDGETLWMSKDPANERRPGILSQGSYGPKVGVSLLLDVLERHAMHATFFVPGWIAERYPDVVQRIHRMGHEIGYHGYKHEWPDPDQPELERSLMEQGLKALREATGSAPVGFRSPAWELTPITLDLLKEHGFLYSSNLLDDFVPYVHPQGIVELPVQWVLDDAPFFMFQTRPPSRPIWPASVAVQAWEEELRGIYFYGGLANLTLHPQFVGRPGRVQALEGFIQTVKSYPNVWMAPLRDVAKYWREQHG